MRETLIVLMLVVFLAGGAFGEWVPLFNGKMDGNWSPLFSHGMNRSHPLLFDVDSDGDADLIWAENDGKLRFWENVGSPSTPDWMMRNDEWGGADGGYYVSAALGDLDNDGDVDLITGNGGGDLYYFENTGGTALDPVCTYVDEDFISLSSGYVGGLSLVDIDNDADLDLYIGNSEGVVLFYINQGDPTASDYVLSDSLFAVLPVDDPVNLCFYDIDSDGDYDMVLQAERVIYLKRNLGTPEVPSWDDLDSTYFPPLSGNPTGVAVWDLYDTGKPAIIVGQRWTRLYHYWNTGTVESPTWEVSPEFWETIDVSYRVRLIFRDLTNDGLPEFLIFGYERGIGLKNIGTADEPNWTINPGLINNLETPNPNPVLGDLDADGDLDVVIATSHSEIMFQENIGTASFPVWADPTTEIFGINYGQYNSPGLVDIDADGDLDLFVGTHSCSLYFHENTGTPSSPEFGSGTLLEEFLDYTTYLYRPAFCFDDYDGDGDYDMFVGCDREYLTLAYWENLGDSTSPVWGDPDGWYVDGSIGGLLDMQVWDYDNDGDKDLVCGSSFGGVVIYLDGGTSGIAEREILPSDFKLTAYPNPFNSSVVIRIQSRLFMGQGSSLPTEALAKVGCQVEIYDINGRLVNSWTGGLVGSGASPGSPDSRFTGYSSYTWSPDENIGSGLYLCRIKAGTRTGFVKILYMK